MIKMLRKPKSSEKTLKSRAKKFVLVNWFIILMIFAAVLMFSVNFSPEVITSDGSTYMLLGEHISSGQYSESFFHRMPLLPSLFAVFYSTGLGIVAISFVVPLMFVIISLMSTFLLAREVAGEKTAKISTILLFCFPEFWRWGLKFLADIPLLALSALTMYLFLKSTKDKKYFLPTGFAAGFGLLTKLSFFILPLAIFIYLAVLRRDLLRTRDLWLAIVVSALIFSSAFLAAALMGATDPFGQLEAVIEHLNPESNTALGPAGAQVVTGQYTTLLYLLNFALFPVLVFSPLGMIRFWKRHDKLTIIYFLLFIAFFFFLWGIRLRYFSPLYPILSMFSVEGFMLLNDRLAGRTMKTSVALFFSFLVFVSFLNTLFLISLDSKMNWGAENLSGYTKTLDGLIASEYMPHYLNITNDVIVDIGWNDEMFRKGNLSYDELRRKNVKYAILSVYGEFSRSPSNDTYHPTIGPFEVAFVSRPYTGERVPPNYTFQSELYQRVEDDGRFKRVHEIYRNSQLTFIIYEVSQV